MPQPSTATVRPPASSAPVCAAPSMPRREAGHHRDPGPGQTGRQPPRERRAGRRRLPGADDRHDRRRQQLGQPLRVGRRPQVQLGRRIVELARALGRPAAARRGARSRDAPRAAARAPRPGAPARSPRRPARSAMVRATRRLRSTPARRQDRPVDRAPQHRLAARRRARSARRTLGASSRPLGGPPARRLPAERRPHPRRHGGAAPRAGRRAAPRRRAAAGARRGPCGRAAARQPRRR